MYKEQAEKYYSNHELYAKAMAAATALDNSLNLDYSKGGISNCHFMMNNYLKYFSYEALTKNKLI